MVNILIGIDDALLSAALLEAAERGMTLDAFVGKAIRHTLVIPNIPTKVVDIPTLLNQAVNRAKEKNAGEEFHLDDLCGADDWDAISGGERKSLGKEFRKAVTNPDCLIANHIGRTSNNKAIYKRV